MGKYFSKFPAITYDGHIAKNLLRRAKIDKSLNSSPHTYYNYEVPEETRADVISSDYYGNPDYSWLIYLANGIVDPYHDYFMSETDFNLYIAKKYGSIQRAMNSVHCWALSWGTDTREISPVEYEALPGSHKKYWTAKVATAYSQPSSYVRSRDENVVSTNRMAIVTVSNPENYEVGTVFVGTDVSENEYRAIIDKVGTDSLTLKHILGSIESDDYVLPDDCLYHIANIPADEADYWFPLTKYDYEAAVNAGKRHIQLVNKQLSYQAEKELKKVLNS